MCTACLRNLREHPLTGDRYGITAEALLFAYLQRDEDKIARRMASLDRLVAEYPELRCPVHWSPAADRRTTDEQPQRSA